MGLRDLFITPFYFMVFTLIGFFLRPYLSNVRTKRYFLLALWARFFGAIALGLIYQFYYGGGDTFGYWEHGSKWIYEGFMDDPVIGFKMLLDDGGVRAEDETFQYTSRIWYYRDTKSYFIVRIAAFFDLFTFHTYSATSLFFAVFSFSGLWALFLIVHQRYQRIIPTKNIAFALLFVPSVVFWGSGILKDTITLGAFGWLIYSVYFIIEKKRYGIHLIILFLSALIIYKIKVYILLASIPAITMWIYWRYQVRIRKAVLRIILLPVLGILFIGLGFIALQRISTLNQEYTFDNVAQRSAATAYDIRYGWGARTGGDGGYDIGIPDGTITGMLRLFPQAVNVSLYRPYLWEVKNLFMFLSALEALIVLVLTFQYLKKKRWKYSLKDPFIMFCLVFTIILAFAVGVSTANFGTLMRYKIPMMPFLFILLFYPRK
ncbi:MAG: hypothetical protein AAF620_08075 [Bacteroidota bacterium]